jgi:hypothetical protein
MKSTTEVHIADVRLLQRSYVAFCGTCDWIGPEHEDPDAAVQDARAHEKDPRASNWKPGMKLKKIRRRL